MSGIFINYRGEDSETAAVLIDRELAAHFGEDRVFLDSRSIPAGADFVDELLGRLQGCSVLLVVIGPRWLTVTDSTGRRRVDDPADWIRREIAEAFALGLRVIPVLTDGLRLPTDEELPADLAGLSRRQYVPLRHRYTAVDLAFLVERITAADPELARVAARRQLDARRVPRQLPAAVPHFAGRSGELATLGAQLDRPAGTVVISAVAGTAGVGKTALAVHWAHQVADRFPDGQLYVNLRGFDPGGAALAPAEAVRRFLDALEVAPERIPVDLDAQAALYRSQLAGRRMLVVLDNARDSTQVRPLLPGAPGCLVLVTSRSQLTGLVATDAAQHITLDVLTDDEARQLLAQRLGAERVAAEPAAVDEVLAHCARLPLALAIVAARAVAQPRVTLGALAGELREAGGRLDALTTDDPGTDARAVFSWSYRALSPAAARLLRLFGLHRGPDLSAPAAASLAGLTVPGVRPLLAELARANLITEPVAGRYTAHDLLRAYAAELAHRDESQRQRHAAINRLLEHYLHTAHGGARLLNPTRDPISLDAPTVSPEEFTGHEAAMAWFGTERAVLLAAVEQAAASGFDLHTWQLAWTLTDFLERGGHWRDWVRCQQAALDAAHRLSDPLLAARAHRALAGANTRLERFDEVHRHLAQALQLYERAADRTGQAHTHTSIGFAWTRQGQHATALHHAEQALELFRAAGHRPGQADTLNAVGWLHAQLGDFQRTLTYCEQALPLLEELGDRTGQAHTWDSLGFAHQHLGQHARAVDAYQHALDLLRDLGDRYHEAATLARIGDAHSAAGTARAARDAWHSALAVFDELDHPEAEQIRTKLAGQLGD